MNFKVINSILPFIALLFFAACGGGGKKSNQVLNADASISDDITFINIADASSLDPEWSVDNTVIYHWTSEPDNMHPTNGNAANRTFINEYTQLTLIASDIVNLSVRPGIVKAYPEISDDGLKYTYELREGLVWDDGKPITIEDVIFTYMANKCPLTDNPHAKPYLENLETITVDSENKNKFTIKMKTKYIQNVIFSTDYPILQRSYFDPNNVMANYTFQQFDDPNFNTNDKKDLNEWATEFNHPKYSRDPQYLVGAGAYQITDWQPGQTMTLTRKENHWTSKVESSVPQEKSYPEKIIFKLNTDENSQMLEFKTQALDVSTYLSTKSLLELQGDPNFNKNYNSKFVDNYNYSYMGMNCKPDGVKHKKFFVDAKVRRAMAHLTPVDNIIKVMLNGKGSRMASVTSPLKKDEYNTALSLIDLDIEKAKALLDEAGWIDSDGDNIRDKEVDGEKLQFSFELAYMTGASATKDIALMIKETMYKAGIVASLKPVEFAVFYDNAKKHLFDMMMGAWASNSTPDDHKQIWHTESWATQGSNFTGFGNAESDDLIDQMRHELNDSVRFELSKKFQKMVYDEQPYIFMYSSSRKTVIHKRFGNGDMYFERPGVMLNNLKLLSLYNTGSMAQTAALEH